MEAAHQRLTKRFEPYHRIAFGLFQDHPTGAQVRAEIERRYGVSVSEKTASDWINRGREAAMGEVGIEVDLNPAEAK